MKDLAEYYIEKLGMLEHYEGGYYKFVCKTDVIIPQENLPKVYDGDRESCSVIYYLLKPGQTSCWHKLLSEEIWFWHAGGTLEMTLGSGENAPVSEKTIMIGSDLEKGETFQAIVPAGKWQTTTPVGDQFVLVSCVVSPAFEVEDFILPV